MSRRLRGPLLVMLFAAACAPRAMPLTPAHPAHPDAETGRLAGPPSALRPGVVRLDTPVSAPPQPVTPAPAAGHEGHH